MVTDGLPWSFPPLLIPAARQQWSHTSETGIKKAWFPIIVARRHVALPSRGGWMGHRAKYLFLTAHQYPRRVGSIRTQAIGVNLSIPALAVLFRCARTGPESTSLGQEVFPPHRIQSSASPMQTYYIRGLCLLGTSKVRNQVRNTRLPPSRSACSPDLGPNRRSPPLPDSAHLYLRTHNILATRSP